MSKIAVMSSYSPLANNVAEMLRLGGMEVFELNQTIPSKEAFKIDLIISEGDISDDLACLKKFKDIEEKYSAKVLFLSGSISNNINLTMLCPRFSQSVIGIPFTYKGLMAKVMQVLSEKGIS
ncbi:hypothetical protein IFO69_21190 [Echinicola sp. CAU 1574]|uniref:Uncharacterized protein n=1 Tax=Echinicola arenosa TaxID=2774144 RepID=A0ABR9AR73_9BACT|nr:hypothetical protein [Echinicola arenosa]MBD8491281.1 hypothetical protein [Echinicola arenosa]